MEKIIIGSIYYAGSVQDPGFDCGSLAGISFGAAVPGKELQWIKLGNGLLVADRCVCTNISWEQLNEKGFVFGTPVNIDSKTYWCRCLRVGAKEDEPNEWDSALAEAGEDEDLWHCKGICFWGQETIMDWPVNRAVRGCLSARYWDYSGALARRVNLGFRPALEFLGFAPCDPDTLVDKRVKIYGSAGVTIEGRLVDFSNYDVMLEANFPVPVDCSWITKEKRNIIVDRENIIWLKEG